MAMRPVGLSRDLPAGRVMRAWAEGQDLAVWRADDGTIAATDNRCPHRGMALSHGFVRGQMLACLYHGWHFAASGRCTRIPAHPDLIEPPATIFTRTFDVLEASGVIWVAVDGTAEAWSMDMAALRSFHVDASEEAWRTASLTVPYKGTLAEAQGDGRYRLGELSLVMLTNPLAAATQVTALVDRNAKVTEKRALSRWCEAVRRAAEGEGAP